MPSIFVLLLLSAAVLAILGLAFPNRSHPLYGAALLCAVIAFLVRA